MQIRKNHWGAFVFIGLLLCVAITFTTGCEPLRKKFTRKKKGTDEQAEAIPLFSPEEYPEHKKSAKDIYQHYYSLWQLWQTDLLEALENGRSDKKIRSDLDQLVLQVTAMQKIVDEEKQKLLIKPLQALQGVQRDMDTPAPLRNVYDMKRTVESVGKSIRKDFSPKNIGDHLIK